MWKIYTPNLSEAVLVSTITVHVFVFVFVFFYFFIFLNAYISTLSKHRFKAGFLRESDNKPSKSGIKEKIEIYTLKF